MLIESVDFEFIRKLVLERSAIVLENGKQYLVETRLVPVAREVGLAGLPELVQKLKNEVYGALHQRVVEAMTTNETSFFRDIHPFETLRAEVLPRAIEARKNDKTLRVWCGATSTGQEPYTIAMVLKEHFAQLKDWKVSIFCTDINKAVLNRAREGKYSQLEVNRGLPAPMLIKYFTRTGTEYQAKDDLRKMMEFKEMNLATEWAAMPAVDILFLRNVLIYFDQEMKKKILGRVKRVLRTDGWMFLGGAETTMNLDEGYERMQLGRSICYRIKR